MDSVPISQPNPSAQPVPAQPALILDRMTGEELTAALDALQARATALQNDALLARIGRARAIKIDDFRGRTWHAVKAIETDLCGTEREAAEGRLTADGAVLAEKPRKPEEPAKKAPAKEVAAGSPSGDAALPGVSAARSASGDSAEPIPSRGTDAAAEGQDPGEVKPSGTDGDPAGLETGAPRKRKRK